ncbi:MAG TPA: glycosyltransferase family 4 protein [Solirubrobacteraceae bacterium]|nr:glycosyltransferase family 4 protein [Solirubrobacteraceae bacterium]
MRVQVVDPSAYTPPYDHAVCRALTMIGQHVELVTSCFAYGPVPAPAGYERRELFYRHALGAPGGRLRTVSKLVEHVPDMLRYRRHAREADIVHFQWLSVQYVDRYLLPANRPLVLTAHDVLPREPRPGQLAAQRRLYDRFDAIVVHSEHGRARLLDELGADRERVHVIPHGVFTHLAEGEPGEARAGWEGAGSAEKKAKTPRAHARRGSPFESDHPVETDRPVVLMFGLMRPYKGIDVLLDAWRGADGEAPVEDAELWIAGMPRMDIATLRAGAPANVRFDPRFITDDELPAYFERAELVVLPYLQADQSGVLFTALAFGKPLLLSDVGGFPEIADTGAARIVPAGDARALGQALRELLRDRAALTEMCVRARAAAHGRYSWEAVARAHVELYAQLLREAPRR